MKINKKEFMKFLKDNLKAEVFDYYACLEELNNQYYQTGIKEYELSSFETKSGRPERFYY